LATGFIYLITNLVNNKIYVGLTETTLARRWTSHKSEAKCGGKQVISRAIRKYGPESFSMKAVEEVPLDQLSDAEIKWVAHCQSSNTKIGYNSTEGGERPTHTPESRKRMSIAKTGTKRSPESIEASGAFHRGRKRSTETVARLKAAALKRPPRGPASEETKAKMKATQSARRVAEKLAGIKINAASGADHPLFGKSPSDETRAKMRAAKATPEAKKKRSEYMRQRPVSEETRKKMSESGKKRTARNRELKALQQSEQAA
jgi:hypothetical protein